MSMPPNLTDEQRLQHLALLRKENKPSGLTPLKGPARERVERAAREGLGVDSEIDKHTNHIEGRTNPARVASELLDALTGNVEHLLRWKVRSIRELQLLLVAVAVISVGCGALGAVSGVLASLLVMR